MSRDKIDVNEFIDSKGDGGIGNSDIMVALEDIDYDISQSDIDSASPDELENEELREIERQIGLSNKQKKKEEKKARSLHNVDDDEEIDPALLYSADSDKAEKASEKPEEAHAEHTELNGDIIDNKSAPAPIKNDEKSSYKNKK